MMGKRILTQTDLLVRSPDYCTIISIRFWANRSVQAVYTKISAPTGQEEQSDQGLHCFLIHRHL